MRIKCNVTSHKKSLKVLFWCWWKNKITKTTCDGERGAAPSCTPLRSFANHPQSTKNAIRIERYDTWANGGVTAGRAERGVVSAGGEEQDMGWDVCRACARCGEGHSNETNGTAGMKDAVRLAALRRVYSGIGDPSKSTP